MLTETERRCKGVGEVTELGRIARTIRSEPVMAAQQTVVQPLDNCREGEAVMPEWCILRIDR